MIRVVIVVPSTPTSSSVENLVARRDVKVVARAPNLDALADQFTEFEPDAVLVDASNESPASILNPLRSSEAAEDVPVVLLADWDTPEPLNEALRAGVRAVLPSDASSNQIFAALQAAAAGLVILHPREMNEILPVTAPSSQSLPDLAEPLTRRESEILQMLASGLANKEIAARLNISDHTVKFHVASVLSKLGAATRTEAVTLGIRRGLVLL